MVNKRFLEVIRRVSKLRILIGAIISIVVGVIIFMLFSSSLPQKKIAVVLANARKDINPCFYEGFDVSPIQNSNIVPVRISVKNGSDSVKEIRNEEAKYRIDDTTSYKGRGSLKIDASNNGVAFRVTNFNSTEASISFNARTEKGKKGHVKVGFMPLKQNMSHEVSITKNAEEVGYIWQRFINSVQCEEKAESLIITIINTDNENPLWIDEVNIRKQSLTNEEIITEKTISILDNLGINYSILYKENLTQSLPEFNAVLIPYYKSILKNICTGEFPIPVYIVHCEPIKEEMPYAGILQSNERIEYTYLEKKGYKFPFVG